MTNKWHVYTFIADRPIRTLKAKIRALTPRTSQQHPRAVLSRLNQIMRGWANYFKHAACKRTLSGLSHFVWWRVMRWLRVLHLIAAIETFIADEIRAIAARHASLHAHFIRHQRSGAPDP